MADRQPTLHVIAGPNGAGKTSFYEDLLRERHPAVEFVNADQLAFEQYGHPACTLEESQFGQDLAEARRDLLMHRGQSMIVESTFSHPSKFDLVRSAIQRGYAARLYHIHLANPELSVRRVRHRVNEGGHPVPEDKIRARFERNPPIIRDAARLADYAYVFDNSALSGPRLVLSFAREKTLHVAQSLPDWTRQIYAPEIDRYTHPSPSWTASYNEAQRLVESHMGTSVQVRVPAALEGICRGKIIGRTALHLVQAIGPTTAMVHVASLVDGDLQIGDHAVIVYVDGRPHVLLPPEKGGTLNTDLDMGNNSVNNVSSMTATGAVQGATVKATGRTYAGEYIQISGVATVGNSCSTNGMLGREADGRLASCVSGTWRRAGY